MTYIRSIIGLPLDSAHRPPDPIPDKVDDFLSFNEGNDDAIGVRDLCVTQSVGIVYNTLTFMDNNVVNLKIGSTNTSISMNSSWHIRAVN